MTDEAAFDLVAPIAIYHWADLCYRKEALAAVRKFRKAGITVPDLGEGGDWSHQKYDELFVSVVENHTDGWTWKLDRWGAKAYFDQHRSYVFAGDASGYFPWYTCSATLLERIADHVKEINERMHENYE